MLAVQCGMTFHRAALMKTAIVLLGGVLAAGCAVGQPGGVPVPSGSVGNPPVSVTPSGQQITMSGFVDRVGVEGGCTVLRAEGGQVYELMGGDSTVLRPGAQVVVTGRLRPDLATICQVGPVLEVVTVVAV